MNKSGHGEPYIVKYAKFQRTRLIDNNNQFHKDIGIGDAKAIAQETELDLVCFNEPTESELAFCKIIDFCKWKYVEEKKKKKQQKVSRHATKEVRFSPLIGDHDIEHKLKQAREFIENGDEVVFSMRLKGRQRSYFKEAEERLNDIVAMCENAKVLSTRKNPSMINIRLGKN